MKIPYSVQRAAKKLGIHTIRKEQLKPIQSIMNRNDTLIIAPTGMGKSAIFQVAALTQDSSFVLVIEPTLSLIYDQVHKLQSLGLSAEYITSTNQKQHDAIGKRIKKQGVTFLYTTPEQLQRSLLHSMNPTMIVVDECHCLLDWGYSFREAYLEVGMFIASLSVRPTIVAMSATLPMSYRERVQTLLGMESVEIFVCSLDKPHLTLLVQDVSGKPIRKKCKKLLTALKSHWKNGSAIVYCNTQNHAAMVYNYLKGAGLEAPVYQCYSAMGSIWREQEEAAFLSRAGGIMVATSAFGMGVDKADVSLVVHFNLPMGVVDYYQQIGRAGRDGRKAKAILFYDDDDYKVNQCMTEKASESKWAKAGLKAMKTIATGNACLMQSVLRVLGEEKKKTCGHCSYCQRRK